MMSSPCIGPYEVTLPLPSKPRHPHPLLCVTVKTDHWPRAILLLQHQKNGSRGWKPLESRQNAVDCRGVVRILAATQMLNRIFVKARLGRAPWQDQMHAYAEGLYLHRERFSGNVHSGLSGSVEADQGKRLDGHPKDQGRL